MIKKLIFSLLITSSLASCAQESVVFKPKFKENTKYRNDMTMNMTSEVDFSGNDAMVEMLKKNGSQMPMLTTNETTMSSVATTKKTDQKGNTPVTIVFEKMSSKMTVQGKTINNENPYQGIKILGKYDNDQQFILDSIVGGKLTEELKKTMTTMSESIQKVIKFPEKPMKVGETFRSETPLSLPIPGTTTMSAKIEINYLLTEIKGNKAYFDVNQTISMNNKQSEMVADGTGTGKMVYDIKDQFITSYKAQLPMEMTTTRNGKVGMKLKMSTSTAQTVTIE